MNKNDNLIVIICSVENEKNAIEIASELILKKLVACVNISPKSLSIFEWNGKIEFRDEHILTIKSFRSNIEKIEEVILSLHKDEIPEIIALDSSYVFDKYENWAREFCGK